MTDPAETRAPGASRRFSLGGFLSGAVAALLSTAQAELLYTTDFEAFPAGPDRWVGFAPDPWLGNSIGSGSHGVDDDQVAVLGKTAYLGANQPNTTLVTVARQIDHDPATSGAARITVDCLLGIEDSTNGRRDSFFLSIYNSTGTWLAALRFSNELATFGIWREDGVNAPVDTGVPFLPGELHLVGIEIDFTSNRWQADLDGIPLFTDAPFTASAGPRDLGSFAVEWQIAGNSAAEFGDNWMLFADCTLWAIPAAEEDFAIDSLLPGPGSTTLEFTGDPGWTYQVEYSSDLSQWHADLPGAIISGLEQKQQVLFTDSTAPGSGRFYRIARTVTP